MTSCLHPSEEEGCRAKGKGPLSSVCFQMFTEVPSNNFLWYSQLPNSVPNYKCCSKFRGLTRCLKFLRKGPSIRQPGSYYLEQIQFQQLTLLHEMTHLWKAGILTMAIVRKKRSKCYLKINEEQKMRGQGPDSKIWKVMPHSRQEPPLTRKSGWSK